MKIYLVLNTETDPYVIDICSNKQIACMLADKYKDNFIRNTDKIPDFIKVKEVDLDNTVDVLWTMYPDSAEVNFSYNLSTDD